jgi:hypothetical protein
MANITIKELLASDTISDVVDKINFNFDQLLLNGGGPVGLTGGSGPLGPQGPRGTTWFTTKDLYTTALTDDTASGYSFPIWSGTPVLVNNTVDFKGDPNKYLPAATTAAPNTYPFYSFTIGTTGNIPKSGDLFLQEGDDNFNGYSSSDGDVWQFNALSNTWSFTGANIKGDTGSTGSSGATEWERTTVSGIDEIHPKLITGSDPVVRVLIGSDDTDIIKDAGTLTNNVVTIYQETGGANLAFTDSSFTGTTVNYANITTGNGQIDINGFNVPGVNNKNVSIYARSGSILLNSQNDSDADITLKLDRDYQKFYFDAATLAVTADPVDLGNKNPVHYLTDTSTTLTIMNNSSITGNDSTTYPYDGDPNGADYRGWGSGNYIRINSIITDGTSNTGDLILQDSYTDSNIGNVGIGDFRTARPTSKLSIGRGKTTEAALSIGDTWSKGSKTVVGTNTYTGYLSNVAFFQTHIVVGATSDSTGFPSVFGGGTSNSAGANSITTDTNINIKSGIIGFNTFFDPSTGLKAMKTDGGYNLPQFIGSGDWLYNKGGLNGGAITSYDLFQTIVIGGNSAATSNYDTVYSNSNLQTSSGQKFNANLVIKSTTNQVGINTSLLQASLNSYGGAIIGKTKTWSGATGPYHGDYKVNNNIILGFPTGSSFISLTNATGQNNATFITTPTWSSGITFDYTAPLGYSQEIATYQSWASDSSYGIYKDYLPSTNSQFKIIHGKNYTRPTGSTFMDTNNNPYNLGTGLEIENRVLTTNSATAAESYKRTPILKSDTGSNIIGNRPIIVTKRPLYINNSRYDDSSTFTLFEISPANNVSVGQSIRFPAKSVWKTIQPNLTPNLTSLAPTGVSQQAGESVLVTLNSGNASRWKDVLSTPGYTNLILPEFNKSLHINSIFDSSSNQQGDVDQFMSKIDAGIVINTGSAAINFGSPTQYLNTYNEYSTQLKGSTNNYSITTSVAFLNKGIDSFISGNYNFFANRPLGVKPGLTIFTNNVEDIDNIEVPIGHLKGADTLISAGDVLYSTLPTYSLKPGDIFITGGHVYKSKIDAYGPGVAGTQGADYAAAELSNTNYTNYQDVDRKIHGNIYIGSIVGDSFGNNHDYIRRTGSIYAGYDSSAPFRNVGIWSDYASPVGNATLNVSGYSYGTEISAPYDERNGKAINIQYGDIVTKNQDAGWQEIDLQTGFINKLFLDGIPFSFNNNLNGDAVFPKGYFKYKVIGYTVFWKLIVNGARFDAANTTSANTYRTSIYLDLNSIDVPAVLNESINTFSTSSGVYRSSNVSSSTGSQATDFNVTGVAIDTNKNMSGYGTVVLRCGAGGFPMTINQADADASELVQVPAYTAPFTATYNGGRLYISQCGNTTMNNTWALTNRGSTSNTNVTVGTNVLMGTTPAVYTPIFYDANILNVLQNYGTSRGGFFPRDTQFNLYGRAISGSNRRYYIDVSMSGQYELDPTWFNV